MMDMDQYQKQAMATAVYPEFGNNVVYPTLGLVGEAGELANKVKKVIRDRGGVFDEEARAAILLELGDVLWYVATLAHEIGADLSAVANVNLHKLSMRADKGTIHGSGDER